MTVQNVDNCCEIIDRITEVIIPFKESTLFRNPSYESGWLGFSLYYSFLARFKNEPEYLQESEVFFKKAIECVKLNNIQENYSNRSLDSELAQLGRFIMFMNKNQVLDIQADDFLDVLDEILSKLMRSKISIKDFDRDTGAIAAGIYYLERLKNNGKVKEELSFLVRAIYGAALKDNDGDFYWESPSLYNRVYLGMSHGSSLIISFVTSVCQNGIEHDLCRQIVLKATQFLLKQYRVTSFKGLFPNRIGDKISNMQFSLCYGDVGPGYALIKANEILKDEKIIGYSRLILNNCLLRSKGDNLTLDASLCYGAAGLGLMFKEIGLFLNDKRFSDRGEYWIGEIPGYRKEGAPYLGFSSRLPTTDPDLVNFWNISFYWGVLGIGVTIMQHYNKTLPSIRELIF